MTTSTYELILPFFLAMSRFGLNFHCIVLHMLCSVDLHNLVWLTEHSLLLFCLAWDRCWMSTYLTKCSFFPSYWL